MDHIVKRSSAKCRSVKVMVLQPQKKLKKRGTYPSNNFKLGIG
jgi:hypothetical protein